MGGLADLTDGGVGRATDVIDEAVGRHIVRNNVAKIPSRCCEQYIRTGYLNRIRKRQITA